MVVNKSVTFINSSQPPSITTKEIDLETCFNDNEIVVEIYAAALNPIDFLVHSFALPLLSGKSLKGYSRDYSGVIIRCGKNITNWKINDKVTGMFSHVYGEQGTLSNYLVLDPSKQTAICHSPQFDDSKYSDFIYNAAWPLVFGTAYTALFNYNQNLGPNSKILVIGASTAVSTAFVQIAKNQLKVGTVVGICSQNSFNYNKELGYDHLVFYDKGSMVDDVKELMNSELKGEKFDLIFDSVGNSDFLSRLDTFLKPMSENSYYMSIVGDSKCNYQSPSILSFLSGCKSIFRYGPFKRYNYAFVLLKPQSEYMKLGSEMIIEKQYKPIIDSVYSFDDYSKALERIKSNKSKGKVVVQVKDTL